MSACIGQQAHAHALMCLRFRAIVRLCELSQQERKHIKQSLVGERFFPEPASNSLCVVEGETKRETDIISENKWKWETMFAAESGLM